MRNQAQRKSLLRFWILEKHASMPPLGIQHVVECPALLPTIERWSASEGDEKEKAE